MSGTVINIIIQLIAGAIGGNVVGNALKDYDLGTLGNSISGASAALPAAPSSRHLSQCSRVQAAVWISAR